MRISQPRQPHEKKSSKGAVRADMPMGDDSLSEDEVKEFEDLYRILSSNPSPQHFTRSPSSRSPQLKYFGGRSPTTASSNISRRPSRSSASPLVKNKKKKPVQKNFKSSFRQSPTATTEVTRASAADERSSTRIRSMEHALEEKDEMIAKMHLKLQLYEQKNLQLKQDLKRYQQYAEASNTPNLMFAPRTSGHRRSSNYQTSASSKALNTQTKDSYRGSPTTTANSRDTSLSPRNQIRPMTSRLSLWSPEEPEQSLQSEQESLEVFEQLEELKLRMNDTLLGWRYAYDEKE